MDPLTITIPRRSFPSNRPSRPWPVKEPYGAIVIRKWSIFAWAIDNAIGPVKVTIVEPKLDMVIEFADPVDLSLFVLNPPISL